MAAVYQIAGWDETYEKTKSRDVNKCSYVCVPNKQDSLGLTNVLAEPDGAAIYGIWILIVERCSRHATPRAGWLTENGKQEGRPYTAEILARMFRRPVGEVQRCLQVTTSADVGWLLECIQDAGSLVPPSLDAAPALPPQGPQETLALDGEKEPGSVSASKSAADTRDPGAATALPPQGSPDASIREGKGTEGKVLPLPSSSLLIQHAEAKTLLSQLGRDVFKEKIYETRWPQELEYALDEQLPLEQSDWDLLDWAYRLNNEHPFFRETMLRQSFPALIKNLRGEIQKIKTARRALGLNGDKPLRAGGAVTEWPKGGREAAAKLWPEAAKNLPDDWQAVAPSVRRDIEAHLKG